MTTDTDVAAIRAKLLELFCRLAYKSGNFTLSSGQSSSYYVNSKLVTLHPYGALWTGQIVLSMLPPDVVAVGGLTLGADPIVSAVSVVSAYENRPIAASIVRKQPKGHGTADWIEGPVLDAGAKVVVLEDVVTTGKSAMLAVERLRLVGYQVDRIIALVDRNQGGAELYAKEGLEFSTIFTIAEIQAHVAQQG
ncbi:orotate phosphoribosyltransferase [Pseudanabaena sp. PCC 6802]|uniref:orotate phosphoribosyltransferase n=1 Tax=Pseudanabaena sp. PCC 6802 TaxID=118173 RepID=UPI00034839C0|nr:orotate phosphoribosyltransferase [Pseudanabaena sp. PCC 6802]